MYASPKMRARSCARTVDAIRSNVVTGNIERYTNDERQTDESLIRSCSSAIVADVQALRSEVEILKRSLEEEKEARRTGDALGGEAVLQLQAILELEGKQRVTSESKLEGQFSKLEGQFQSVLSKLYDEVSDLRREARDIGTSSDFRTFRLELDREIRHRFEELSKSVHMNQRNAHEHSSARLSEIMRRFEDEREERQMEVKSIHQELTTLSEQTKISLEEEASHLWEALHSHNHDIIIEDENSSQVGNVQVQAVADKAGFKSTHKIQPNHSCKSSMTTSCSKLHQTDGKGTHHHGVNQPQHEERIRCQTNGKGAHHQDANQHQGTYRHQSPPHSYRTRNFLGNLDLQPRIFAPGVYPE